LWGTETFATRTSGFQSESACSLGRILRKIANSGGDRVVASQLEFFVSNKYVEGGISRCVAVDLEGELSCGSVQLREVTALLLALKHVVERGIRQRARDPGLTHIKRNGGFGSGGNDNRDR
jgi:hypothetical protein